MPSTEPTCCLLTNSGRGAVAVVGIAGSIDHLTQIIDPLFKPVGSRSFQTLVQLTKQVIFYGQWKSTAEDLVVVKTKFGLEIHCHGGDAASTAIVDDLVHSGCESVQQQAWRLLHCDRWQAETETAICAATTTRTASLLLKALQNQTTALAELSAKIAAQQVPAAVADIEHALSWANFGMSLTAPRSVVFCGHPNVGKSSLVNVVAGFQRAIVNSQAGTTRDVLSQATAIDGWPIELKDTAGLRVSQDRVEALGIEKAKQEIARSQIRCLVFSCEDFSGDQQQVEDALTTHRELLQSLSPQLVVFNKADLVPDFKVPAELDFAGPVLVVSAADQAGLQSLVNCIADVLAPKLPTDKDWFPVSTWQKDQLQSILHKVNQNKFDEARALLEPY